MSDAIWNGVFAALVAYMTYGVIRFAYKTAKDSAEKTSPFTLCWQGFLFCAFHAAIFASLLGKPSCEEPSDPIYGGCDSYSDDGYEPTNEDLMEKFIKIFLILYGPVFVAASKVADRRGWRALNKDMLEHKESK